MEDFQDLYGAHDEADTRVAFHAIHAEQCDPGNTVIRCNDTDILVIMLSNIQKFIETSVWLDMGLDYNNSRTFIDVKATADEMNHIQALPGIYAFTGCDYTPTFFRKGKKRPIEIMSKSDQFINVFNKMGEEDLSEDDMDVLESFTCSIYGYSKLTSINEARYLHFKRKCKPKEAAKPLDCLKNVDPSLFPPCKRVLLEQVKRSWYISKLYKNATVSYPLANYTLLDYGFEFIDGYVHVKWFDGEQVPQDLEDDDDIDMEHNDGNEYDSEEEDEVSDDEGSEDGESEDDDNDEVDEDQED